MRFIESLLRCFYVICFIFSNRSIYGCDDLAPFINTCIDKMEALDLLKVSSTLSAFFQRFDQLTKMLCRCIEV